MSACAPFRNLLTIPLVYKSIYLSRLFSTSTHCNIINLACIYTVRHTNKTNIKMRQLPMKVLLNM